MGERKLGERKEFIRGHLPAWRLSQTFGNCYAAGLHTPWPFLPWNLEHRSFIKYSWSFTYVLGLSDIAVHMPAKSPLLWNLHSTQHYKAQKNKV